ncbi:hypothetical protein [Microcella sp.]|uniref:hypothetical protein n=1 Tax=Microcella sp. TaxID=1913979 RepID=UPI00391B74E9
MRPARRPHGACWRRPRILALLLAPLAIAAPLAVAPAAPAHAAAAWGIANDTFVGENVVTLTGTKDEGSTLVIRRAGQSGIICSISDPASTSWSCPPLQVSNGTIEFTAVQTFDDDSTAPLPTLRLRVLGPPTVSSNGGRIVTAGRVVGRGQPGARLQVQTIGANGQVTHACPDVLPDGFWSCALSSQNAPGGEYQVRARQSLPSLGSEFSVFSGSVPMTLDREAPAPPTVSSPTPGMMLDQPRVIARGGGEAGASIQVFVNGEQRCQTQASGSGAWECTIAFSGPGTWDVQALQRDAAGNFSAPTARIPVTVESPNGASPSPTPSPTSPSPNEPGPGTPAPPPPAPDSPETPGTPDNDGADDSDANDETATPSPPPGPGGPTPPDPVGPGAPGSGAGDTNWGTPTTFGASLPTAADVWKRGGWLIGILVGLGYLLLVAWPMRLVTQGSLPRLLPAGFQLTGRNRAVTDDDRPILPGWLVAAGVLGGATLVAALSGGIDLEVRYLRLMAAIGAALLALNLFAVVIPARLAGRLTSAVVTDRLLPSMLVAATATALLSRLWDLQPPILIGVLVATTIVGFVPRAARAGVAVAQTSGVAVMALIGWAVHDLLSPAVGFWANLAAEGAAALALGGFGSIVLLLLPIGPFPGRTLYAISRPVWAIVTVVTAAVGAAIAVSGPSFPIVPLAGLAAAFGAVCLAIVAWTRWVEPSLR